MVAPTIQKCQSFLEFFHPFHVATRLTGLNQFYLPRNYRDSGKIILKQSAVLYLLLQTFMFVSIQAAQWAFRLDQVSLLAQIMTIMSGLSTLQWSFVDYKNRNRIGSIISELHDIDCMVREDFPQLHPVARTTKKNWFHFRWCEWAVCQRTIKNWNQCWQFRSRFCSPL